jgi:glucose/arabinose dehydrogenase
MSRRVIRPALLFGMVAAYAHAYSHPALAQTLNDPKLHVREVTSGLSQPTAMAFIGPGDILVLQKGNGLVRRVINGILQPGHVLDVAVDSASERGLLGIAIHPSFPSTPFVYLYYTQSSTAGDSSGSPLANRVYRYTWNGSALVSPSLLLDLPATPGPNHDGGTMTFGPDGKLYIVIGDLNRDGQLQNFSGGPAPDNTGVIFRVNDDGSTPNDNPFFALGGNLTNYYAYGVRNSFGLAFDPITGELWDTENGPNSYDEINLVLPGFNSGWEQIMGPDSRDPQGVMNLVQFSGSHYADPKFSWLNTVGPTALAFLNSRRLGTQYKNDLFVGDIINGNLYRFRVNAGRDGFDFNSPGLSDLVADSGAEFQEMLLGTGFGGITDIKVGPDGLLYVLSFGLGKIFAISGQPASVDFDGDGKSDIGIYRDGTWFILRSSDGGMRATGWGLPQDIRVFQDYDGDGEADIAVYRDGIWYVVRSSDGGVTTTGWGGLLADVPVPGDYDGDGKADIAVYRNGTWFIIRSSDGGFTIAGWGGSPQDIAVPADYDGDGKIDLAVYRGGLWFIRRSSDGVQATVSWGGLAQDIVVPGDYDGDGKTDVAVYRNGTWFIIRTSDGGFTITGWGGLLQDIPVPADYDGDGRTDIAVYRDGIWFILRSSDGGQTTVGWGGLPQDIPLNIDGKPPNPPPSVSRLKRPMNEIPS